MPRTGGGTGPFVLNPVYLAVPGTTILATQHNTPLEDIEDTFNIPQPIAYGGTQGASAIEAMDNLFIVGADKASSASIDLDNVTGSFVNITGTTPVTSIALAEGAIRFARAVAALPLTASASLIVNGSTTQAYTCEAGDQMMIIGYAGAIVRIWVTGRNKFIASQFKIADGTDQTKQVQFSASGLPTATTRTLDAPYYSGTLGLVSDIRGQIYGLTLSNNSTDPTNDIDFAIGSAVDSTGAVSMQLLSGITKRLDAAWAVGTNQGGRMSAAALADGTYYVYLIRRPDTGAVDAGFDVSATAPTLPTNYTQYRRIGAIKRAGGTILAFWQNGRYFELSVPIFSVDAAGNFGTSAVIRAVSGVGLAIPVRVIVRSGSATGATFVRYSSPFSADVAASATNSQIASIPTYTATAQLDIVVDAANQIRERRSFSAADSTSQITTVGWTDLATLG